VTEFPLSRCYLVSIGASRSVPTTIGTSYTAEPPVNGAELLFAKSVLCPEALASSIGHSIERNPGELSANVSDRIRALTGLLRSTRVSEFSCEHGRDLKRNDLCVPEHRDRRIRACIAILVSTCNSRRRVSWDRAVAVWPNPAQCFRSEASPRVPLKRIELLTPGILQDQR
jgi:hypothetical protein